MLRVACGDASALISGYAQQSAKSNRLAAVFMVSLGTS
jgi:hypothetical protein